MKTNVKISLILGLPISAIALYLSFKNVPFSDFVIYLKSINYFWIFPSVVIILTSFALRTLRWRIILEPACRLSFWQAFHPLIIGFMLNSILPGRVGEVARPIILQQRDNVPFSTGLATIAAERLLDVSMLIILFICMLAFVHIDPVLDISFGSYHLNRETLIVIVAGMFKLSLVIIAGVIIISIAATRRLVARLIMWIPAIFFSAGIDFKNRIREKFCRPVVSFLESFALGLALIKDPKKVVVCIGLSIAIWGLACLSFYVIALGCPGILLSYFEIMMVMIIICLFIALPSVPGFWGLWEAGGVFALSIFGIPANQGVGFTIVNHVVQIIPVIIIGVISAVITGVNIWKLSDNKNSASQI